MEESYASDSYPIRPHPHLSIAINLLYISQFFSPFFYRKKYCCKLNHKLINPLRLRFRSLKSIAMTITKLNSSLNDNFKSYITLNSYWTKVGFIFYTKFTFFFCIITIDTSNAIRFERGFKCQWKSNINNLYVNLIVDGVLCNGYVFCANISI